MKRVKLFAAIFLAGVICFPAAARAEKYQDPDSRFEIEIPAGWAPHVPEYEGVAATFVESVSGASVNISVRDAGEGAKVEDLKWEDLFSPKFEEVSMRMQGQTMIDGGKAKYCLYTLTGAFKKQMEGKNSLMYLNYVMVRNGKLFSVTFKDREAEFVGRQPEFFRIIRSMAFPKQA